MNEQIKRIQGFVESLEKNVLNEEQQSLVLSSDLNSIGGDNKGICINEIESACSGKNENCTNRNVCDLTTNTKKCSNTNNGDLSPMNPECTAP